MQAVYMHFPHLLHATHNAMEFYELVYYLC